MGEFLLSGSAPTARRQGAAVHGRADVSSLWTATAQPAPVAPSLPQSRRADVAIVGGGYAGLSAALHLAEGGAAVVVLEAAEPGWGASGRNGGQVTSYEFHWSGRVALTRDHLPHLHEPAPGLTASLGCNGRGVGLATAMGMVLADYVLRPERTTLPIPPTPIRRIPLHRLHRLYVSALIGYYRLRDHWSRA